MEGPRKLFERLLALSDVRGTIIPTMARGWESKSVEDQISERERATELSAAVSKPDPNALQVRARRDGLHMVRTRTLMSLQSACEAGYRAHLERVLADLDEKLLALDAPNDLRKS